MNIKHLLATTIVVATTVACTTPTSPTNTSADPIAAQVAKGAELYGAECAHCHGDGGEGTKKGPKVVGTGALPLDPPDGAKRNVQFRTALDVFKWASVAMPGDDAGSLPAEDMVAIFAFDLTANGIKLKRPLDAALAAEIVLHP